MDEHQANLGHACGQHRVQQAQDQGCSASKSPAFYRRPEVFQVRIHRVSMTFPVGRGSTSDCEWTFSLNAFLQLPSSHHHLPGLCGPWRLSIRLSCGFLSFRQLCMDLAHTFSHLSQGHRHMQCRSSIRVVLLASCALPIS